ALHGVGGAPAQPMRDPALDVDADLGRGAAFGLAHRRRDGVEVRLREEPPRPAGVAPEHHHSPLAPPPPELPPPPPEKPPSPPPPHEPPPPPPPQKIGGCELQPRRSAVTARCEDRRALKIATPKTPKNSANRRTVAGS